MKKMYLFFFLFISSIGIYAQHITPEPLRTDAERLSLAYEVLMKNKLATNSQLLYLQRFPKTKDDFIAIFDPDDGKQLHKVSHQYIEAFKEIASNFPDSVLRIGLGISKQMKWATGPSEDLQQAILEIGASHPESFVNEIYLLKKKEIAPTVSYLADVEQNPLCSLYKDLIKNLQDIGAYNISGRLVRSKGQSH